MLTTEKKKLRPGAVLNDTVGTSAFCQGHDLLRVCLWKGALCVMVMEDCQCSYTGLFDQVPGEIRSGSRAVASLTVPGAWARVSLSSFFPNFDHFFLFFLKRFSFSSSFWLSGWATRLPGKALATPLTGRVISKPKPPPCFH